MILRYFFGHQKVLVGHLFSLTLFSGVILQSFTTPTPLPSSPLFVDKILGTVGAIMVFVLSLAPSQTGNILIDIQFTFWLISIFLLLVSNISFQSSSESVFNANLCTHQQT